MHIQNRKTCLTKKILYQYFVVLLPKLVPLLILKRFMCYYIGLKTGS